jgi:hypothetical protein
MQFRARNTNQPIDPVRAKTALLNPEVHRLRVRVHLFREIPQRSCPRFARRPGSTWHLLARRLQAWRFLPEQASAFQCQPGQRYAQIRIIVDPEIRAEGRFLSMLVAHSGKHAVTASESF